MLLPNLNGLTCQTDDSKTGVGKALYIGIQQIRFTLYNGHIFIFSGGLPHPKVRKFVLVI